MRYTAALTLFGVSLATGQFYNACPIFPSSMGSALTEPAASTLPPLTRAFNPVPFSSLQARQLPLSLDSFIPESCLETCAPTRATYESCVTDEDDNCEALCTQEEYDAFVDCQNCALQGVNRTYTEEEAETLRENKKELEDVCTSIVARIDTKEL